MKHPESAPRFAIIWNGSRPTERILWTVAVQDWWDTRPSTVRHLTLNEAPADEPDERLEMPK